jgi:hypothetical protein
MFYYGYDDELVTLKGLGMFPGYLSRKDLFVG